MDRPTDRTTIPRARRRAWLPAACSVVAIVLAGAWYAASSGLLRWGIRRADTVERLVAEESGRGQRRLAAYSQRWERPPTAAEEAAQWAQLPHLLAERGASEPEAKAVSGALRATAEARTVSGHHLICMPVYVEEGHAGAARVWLIGVAWGLRGTGANGADERLGHVWFVAIDRGSPHAVLAQISCG